MMNNFDDLKKFYERCNYPGEYTEEEIMCLHERFPLNEYMNGLVFDAGCGTGLMANIIAQNSTVSHVDAIDLSANSIRVANQNTIKDNIFFINGNILDYSGSPDVIYCNGVLHHLRDYQPIVDHFVKLSPKIIIVGLYHPFFRKLFNIRRRFDDRRSGKNGKVWDKDQYHHVYEKCIWPDSFKIQKYHVIDYIRAPFTSSIKNGGFYNLVFEND